MAASFQLTAAHVGQHQCWGNSQLARQKNLGFLVLSLTRCLTVVKLPHRSELVNWAKWNGMRSL